MNDKIFVRSSKSRDGKEQSVVPAGVPMGLVKRPERKENFKKKEPKQPNLNTVEGLFAQV